MAEFGNPSSVTGSWTPPATLDEARARARVRFKERLESGAKIGECGCGEDDAVLGEYVDSPAECVLGVRFRDSGRIYYFRADQEESAVGDWVVVATARGEEAGRVVIAPHQVRRALLQGELGRVLRVMNESDVARMEAVRHGGPDAIRTFGERSRARRLGIKPIAADYSFDGAVVYLSYSVPDRERAPDTGMLRELAQDLASTLRCRIELRQVGPRDEARLLGGLGRCGRTLCCSSWLPVFPEISMGMAKNQDLPLNPSKVSGVCGRLLCCLSYENDQYRQMKAVMPRLGQSIETPGGPGLVVSMHLLRELVTVRLEDDNSEVTFRGDELGLGVPREKPIDLPVPRAQTDAFVPLSEEAALEIIVPPVPQDPDASSAKRRRRRRSGRRGGSSS